MKNVLLIFLTIILIKSAHAQTYIIGNRVVSFANVANSSMLPNNQRLPIDEAYNLYKQLAPEIMLKHVNSPEKSQGEFWLINSMLVNIITRTTTPEYLQEDFKNAQRAVAPSIHINDPGDKLYNEIKRREWYSEIKQYDDFEALIYYFKKDEKYKSFHIQDKKGNYRIIFRIYVEEQDASKAHALINQILSNISIK